MMDERLVIVGHWLLTSREKTAAGRIFDMTYDLLNLLDEYKGFLEVILEVPASRVFTSRHAGGGRGLAIYGMAVGYIWHALKVAESVSTVHLVKADEWTGGHSKAKRVAVAQRAAPDYDPKTDRGHDVADAISLLIWWRDHKHGAKGVRG